MIEKRYRGAILASISASIGGTTVVLTRYLMPDSDPFSITWHQVWHWRYIAFNNIILTKEK